MTASPPTIVTEGLRKRYGDAHALDGIDLEVPQGAVCGLLGPNGAGKTTAVRILSTLLRRDGGRAEVAGFDVGTQAAQVRTRIGLTGQQHAIEEGLTGRENLVMFARLHHLDGRAARRRADELLEQFGLTEAAGRRAKHYSGGMARRLDLAASFIAAPQVLFLDEPTTGQDPRNRIEVWNVVRGLVAGGTTVLLTTHYLDEADQLADQIVVLDRGRVIAGDTPGRLKARIGASQLELTLAADDGPLTGEDALAAAAAIVDRAAAGPVELDRDARRVSAPIRDRVAALGAVLRGLEDAGIAAEDVALRAPTLDEVFLQLTGERATEVAP